MQSLRQLLGMSTQAGAQGHGAGIPLRTQSESPTAKRAKWRVELLDAMNGRVLEVAHRPDIHSDWEIDLYIVRDDEALADAIATVLVLRGGK